MTEDLSYWYALTYGSGLSHSQVHALLAQWRETDGGGLALLFEAPASIVDKIGFSAENRTGLERAREAVEEARETLAEVRTAGVQVVTCEDEAYPEAMTQVLGRSRPPMLFCIGNLALLKEPSVAIVGSRKPSDISLEFTRACANAFAQEGRVVISGFAEGVDRCASAASLDAGGSTVLVLAQGILTFGSQTKALGNGIDRGDILVLSAFTPRVAWQTPLAMARNAMITALCPEVIVSQARETGGSWETARMALRQHRRLWVRCDSDPELGHEELARLGAHLVHWPGGDAFDTWVQETCGSVVSDRKFPDTWTTKSALTLLRKGAPSDIHDATGITGQLLKNICEGRDHVELKSLDDVQKIAGIGPATATEVAVAFGLAEKKQADPQMDLFPEVEEFSSWKQDEVDEEAQNERQKSARQKRAEAKRPNILVIMTDHQRADTVGADGTAKTPNIDRLARDGVRFTRTYTPTAHCCPARATFHSGLYPTGHGVWNNVCTTTAIRTGPYDHVRLWSEDLADADYRMHWFGKWHVSSEKDPSHYRWTQHLRNCGTDMPPSDSWDFYQKRADEQEPTQRGEGEILRPGYGPYRLYEEDTVGSMLDEEVENCFLAEFPQFSKGDKPWCAFVGFIGPHDPYRAPQRLLDQYPLDEITLPPSYSDDLSDKPAVYQRLRGQVWSQLTEREVREAIRHYRAYCTYLDEKVGRIMKALEASGQAENTLLVYLSDHGDYCGDHGLFAKGVAAFDGAYRVPNVMRWPGGIANPGRDVQSQVSLADFAPTFLELAGVEPERSFAGQSLTPFLRDEQPETWREAMFTQFNGVELYYTQRAVWTETHKYVFNGFDFDELYDLREDPHERRNLTRDPACDAVRKDLLGRLWEFAYEQRDMAVNNYITVGLAPYGPAEGIRRARRNKTNQD